MLAGGTLVIGTALPAGAPQIDVSAIITGPQGGQVSLTRSDRAAVIGDPLVTASLGWASGKTHVAEDDPAGRCPVTTLRARSAPCTDRFAA